MPFGWSQILEETESRNTWENALCVDMLYSPTSVVLVTSAYHMRRGMYSFESRGIRCIPAPTDFMSIKTGYSYLSFLPRMASFRGSHLAIKEWLGLIYYRVRYWRRKDTHEPLESGELSAAGVAD